MNDAFTKLSTTDLQAMIAALRSGRLSSPYSGLQVARVVPAAVSAVVRTAILELQTAGFSGEQIATVLSLIEADRIRNQPSELPIDLVTSGPEAPGISSRDTSVVVRELFAHASTSVLVVGYAVYQGQQVFEALAKRMEAITDLDVKFFSEHRPTRRRPDAVRNPRDPIQTAIQRQAMAPWLSAAGGVLRSTIACRRTDHPLIPAREMHRRRLFTGLRIFRQLHRSRSGTQHRSGTKD